MTITQDAIDAAALKRIRVITSLDGILSQAKAAKKRVGSADGARYIRDHIAAMQRQLDLLKNHYPA